MAAHSIEVKAISKSFGDTSVLQEVSLCIDKGEIFALLGPSGAGKTTLIQIMTGQLKQDGGRAVILGRDSLSLTGELYRRLGMVLDNAGLYLRLSCYDNLLLFAELHRRPKSRIHEVLHQVGLKDAAKKPVHALSKGMQKRLVLARAILHRPELLFLDEPTSGLDPTTAAEIHGLLLEQQAHGTTLFLTTHNMEEATKLCSHVALLHQGKILEYGNPGDICRKYNHKKQLLLLLKNGEQLTLKHTADSADILQQLLLNEQIESIHSSEPDLEAVFMELTGKGLKA